MAVKFRYRLAAGAQRLVCRVVLFFLFRALNALAVRDERVAAEIARWPEGRVTALTMPGGPGLAFARQGKRLRRLKSQLGVAGAYAQHRFTVRGSVSDAMGFVRCVDLAEGYLFPAFWARAILKELPQKRLSSLRVYAAALLGR